MQRHTRFRIFGLLFFLFCAAAAAYNWHELVTKGEYSLEASGLAPMGALFGLALVFSPSAAFRPRPGDKRAVMAFLIVGIIGLVLGSINFYLMDHYR